MSLGQTFETAMEFLEKFSEQRDSESSRPPTHTLALSETIGDPNRGLGPRPTQDDQDQADYIEKILGPPHDQKLTSAKATLSVLSTDFRSISDETA